MTLRMPFSIWLSMLSFWLLIFLELLSQLFYSLSIFLELFVFVWCFFYLHSEQIIEPLYLAKIMPIFLRNIFHHIGIISKYTVQSVYLTLIISDISLIIRKTINQLTFMLKLSVYCI